MFRLYSKTKKGIRYGLVEYKTFDEANERAKELNKMGKKKFYVGRI